MPVESELERGARMKSVGILSPSYTLLYRHMHFLENQVRCVAHRRGGRRRAGGGDEPSGLKVVRAVGASLGTSVATFHASDGGLCISACVLCSSESWDRFCFQFILTLSSILFNQFVDMYSDLYFPSTTIKPPFQLPPSTLLRPHHLLFGVIVIMGGN